MSRADSCDRYAPFMSHTCNAPLLSMITVVYTAHGQQHWLPPHSLSAIAHSAGGSCHSETTWQYDSEHHLISIHWWYTHTLPSGCTTQ